MRCHSYTRFGSQLLKTCIPETRRCTVHADVRNRRGYADDLCYNSMVSTMLLALLPYVHMPCVKERRTGASLESMSLKFDREVGDSSTPTGPLTSNPTHLPGPLCARAIAIAMA